MHMRHSEESDRRQIQAADSSKREPKTQHPRAHQSHTKVSNIESNSRRRASQLANCCSLQHQPKFGQTPLSNQPHSVAFELDPRANVISSCKLAQLVRHQRSNQPKPQPQPKQHKLPAASKLATANCLALGCISPETRFKPNYFKSNNICQPLSEIRFSIEIFHIHSTADVK